MRFVAAQFLALLDDDLWLASPAHSNAHGAARCYDGDARPPRRRPASPPEVNSLFPRLPPEVITPLQEW